jgi:hypothetical protein
LIERFELPADHAFRLLSVASMNANRKLRLVAEDLVRTGELPTVRPGGDRRPFPPRRTAEYPPGATRLRRALAAALP